MKSQEVSQIIAAEFNLPVTADLVDINKTLKEKGASVKFRITGEKLGYLGYTVPVKNITAEGIKVITVSKVILIRFADIATFQKAKPKTERKVYSKTIVEEAGPSAKKAAKPPKKSRFVDDDDDDDDDDIDFDDDDDDDDDIIPVARPKRRRPKTGSSFIPEKGRVKGKIR